MDFVYKLYGNTYAVHVTVALVGVATLNIALPALPASAILKNVILCKDRSIILEYQKKNK